MKDVIIIVLNMNIYRIIEITLITINVNVKNGLTITLQFAVIFLLIY